MLGGAETLQQLHYEEDLRWRSLVASKGKVFAIPRPAKPYTLRFLEAFKVSGRLGFSMLGIRLEPIDD